jgi:ribonuclease PH
LAAVYGPIAPRIPSQEKGDKAAVSVVIKSGNHNAAAASAKSTSSNASSSGTGMMEREWEQLLTNVLAACIDTKMYARTVVQVVLQVIQDDGAVLSACLHAAVAALMDAGVAMTSLPVATTFLIMSFPLEEQQQQGQQEQQQGQMISSTLLDPTSEEELEPEASLLVLVTENERPERILATHSSMAASCSRTQKTTTTIKNSNTTNTPAAVSLAVILSCAQAAAKATPAVVTFWRLAMEQRVTRESQTLWSSSS